MNFSNTNSKITYIIDENWWVGREVVYSLRHIFGWPECEQVDMYFIRRVRNQTRSKINPIKTKIEQETHK